jgi:hypothetical protein
MWCDPKITFRAHWLRRLAGFPVPPQEPAITVPLSYLLTHIWRHNFGKSD